jgi:hypothetical protein
MALNKYTLVLGIGLLIIGLHAVLEMKNSVVRAASSRKDHLPSSSGFSTLKDMALAQLEKKTRTEKEKTESSSERNAGDSEEETKTGKSKQDSGAKPKPLKSFVPSEKIEADQAVDFPYDI